MNPLPLIGAFLSQSLKDLSIHLMVTGEILDRSRNARVLGFDRSSCFLTHRFSFLLQPPELLGLKPIHDEPS